MHGPCDGLKREVFVFNIFLVEMCASAVEKGTAVTRELCHTATCTCKHTHSHLDLHLSVCSLSMASEHFWVGRVELWEKKKKLAHEHKETA